jgi:tetratricopeptide (TPR) repeat protein
LLCFTAALVLAGCGGTNAEEVERSMTEFQLAATMREEGNLPGAHEHLRRALELDPENGLAHVLLGYIFLERHEAVTAEGHIRKGIEILEQQPDMAASLSEARNMLGLALLEQERYDDAITVLTASAADLLNRAAYVAWGNLGLAHFEKGDYPQAIEALQQSVRSEPRFCVGHFRLGQTFFAMERFEEAEESLTHALEADERCGQVYQSAWKLRGEVRARLGKREEAVADFERCVEIGERTEDGRACQRLLSAP